MSTSAPIDLSLVKLAIHNRHIQQLQEIAATEDLVLLPEPSHFPFPILATADDIVQWTKDSMPTINKAKANRVYGGGRTTPIDFNNAFMAFMESATVYLRDTSSVVQAVHTLRTGGPDSVEEAGRILAQSTSQIKKIADMWGMDFIVICDLVTKHPDGHTFIVGPFCGAFVSRDIGGKNPYFGIAFKGTSVTAEVINDLMAIMTTKGGNWLWNRSICEGFFWPLFSTYDTGHTKIPFATIQAAARDIMSKASSSTVTHVTGHSLGGAYATLTYSQLCISGFGGTRAPLFLGDLYTYGSPRPGRNDFASALKDSMTSPYNTAGASWRIVNNNDYVPEVPVTLIPWWPNPFVHVDSGWKVYKDKKPTQLKSEIGTNPWPGILKGFSPHYTTEYYKSLTYATTGRQPRNAVKTQRSAAALTVFPNRVDSYSLSLDHVQLNAQDKVNISLETYEDLVEGTIKVGQFIGEIIALGSFHGTLDKDPSFSCTSWQKLFSDQNQCVFKKEADGRLGIYFILDEEVVGHATVASDAEDADIDVTDIARGSCNWSLDADDPEVEKLSAALATAFASIFPEEPAKLANGSAA